MRRTRGKVLLAQYATLRAAWQCAQGWQADMHVAEDVNAKIREKESLVMHNNISWRQDGPQLPEVPGNEEVAKKAETIVNPLIMVST